MIRRSHLLLASLFCGILALPLIASAQPAIGWSATYGGTQVDQARAVVHTVDGGYAFVGSTQSKDGDVTKHYGGFDMWFAKISSTGALQGQKTFGGSGLDQGLSIQQTFDLGYIIAGQTQSNDSLLLGELHGGKNAPSDAWVVKLDSVANIEWQYTYGGTGADICNAIIQTSDSGYAFVGTTHSKDGDASGNKGLSNLWVVKLTKKGIVDWSKCFGGTYEDGGNTIIQTSAGDYMVAGFATSGDGDVVGNHGSYDFWVARIDTAGKLEWASPYGGTGQDIAYSIAETSDHGFALAGSTVSKDGQVVGLHNPSGGNSDCWIVKIGSTGALQWAKAIGGSSEDYAYSILQTPDLGYVFAGTTLSSDGDVSGYLGGASDMWAVKLSDTGAIEWQLPLGGSGVDQGYNVILTPDKGYVLAGQTASSDSDIQMLHSYNVADAWIIKLLPENQSAPNTFLASSLAVSVFPNPGRGEENISYNLGAPSAMRIDLYNAIGQLVKEANLGIVAAGGHSLRMNLAALPAGQYFMRVVTSMFSSMNSIVLER